MIVLAIVATVAALILTGVVVLANGMATSRRDFQGAALLVGAWAGVVVFWLVWWFR